MMGVKIAFRKSYKKSPDALSDLLDLNHNHALNAHMLEEFRATNDPQARDHLKHLGQAVMDLPVRATRAKV
jgi:hypothetical protein